MYTISQAIESILESSPTASEAMRQGILNRTAFAKQIQKEVEKETMKQVNLNTIVVALTRIEPKIKKSTPLLLPDFKVLQLVVSPGVFEVVYIKTPEVIKALDSLDAILPEKMNYFAVVRGNEIISVVAPEEVREKILNHFPAKPKNIYTDLSAITIKHPEEYLEMDNVVYTWLNRIVTRRISFIDVIEANIELTVISPTRFTDKIVQAYSGWVTK